MSQLDFAIHISALIDGMDKVVQLKNDMAALSGALGTVGNESGSAAGGLNATDAAARTTAAAATGAAAGIDRIDASLAGVHGAANSAQAGLVNVSAAASDLTAAANGTGGGVGGASGKLTEMAENAGLPLNPITSLTDGLKTLAGGILAFIAVASLKEAADLAAKVELLGVTMSVVGKNAGYSKDQLAGYEKGVENLGITTQAARSAITQMINAGLELGPVAKGGADQVTLLARAAQDLAVVMGTNSSETFQSLITNIQQMDTEGFRYMGLTIDVTAAQQKFATSIGKTVESLTGQQKTQAVTNEVMDQSQKFTGAYEESLQSVGKQLQSLPRYQEEFALSIGNHLLRAYGALITSAREFLKHETEVVSGMDKSGNAASGLAHFVSEAADAVLGLFSYIIDTAAQTSEGFGSIAQAAGDLIVVFSDLGSNAKDQAESQVTLGNVINEVFKAVGLTIAAVADGLQICRAVALEFLAGVNENFGVLIGSFGTLVSYVFPETGKAIQDIGAKMELIGKKQEETAGKIVQGFADGNSSVQTFLKTVDQVGITLESVGKAKGFRDLEEQIRLVTDAQRKNTLSSTEVVAQLKLIEERTAALGATGALTQKEVSQLHASMAAAASKTVAAYQQAFKDMGISENDLKGNTTEAAGIIIGGLQGVASSAITTADVFASAFDYTAQSAKTVQDLQKVIDTINVFGIRGKESGDAAKLSQEQLQERYRVSHDALDALTESALKNAHTSGDFNQLADSVQKVGVQLIAAGEIGQADLDAKLRRIADAAEESKLKLENLSAVNPLKDIGLSFLEIRTGVSDATEAVTQSFDAIIASGKLTSDELYQVFNQKMDTAKTVADIGQIKQSIIDAGAAGALFGTAYSSALQSVGDKFDDVFKKQLSTAKTREDFNLLTESTKQLGESGTISGQKMALALAEISEKATGARESIQRLSSQAVDLSAESLKVTQAQTAAYKAGLDVQTAQNGVLAAQAQYTKDGTEASRLQLVAKQADLALSREKLTLAKLVAAEESAAYDVLIAKQRVLNAEKAVETATDKAGAQALEVAAQKVLDTKQLALNNTQQEVNAQGEVVARTEAAAAQARQLADAMKKTEQNTKSAATAMSQLTAAGQSLAGKTFSAESVDSLTQKFKEMGYSAVEAARLATEAFETANSRLANSNKLLGGGWGGQLTNLNYAADIIKRIADGKKYQDDRDAITAKNTAANQQAESDKASEITAKYNATKEAAQATVDATGKSVAAGANLSNVLGGVGQAMRQIAKDAQSVAQSAIDASSQFLKSTQSIHNELLTAQGQQEAATRSQFSSRQVELKLEYELLKVKIQAAEVTAKAAGVDTSGLEKSLSEASAGFASAQADLAELEKISLDKLSKDKAAAAAQAQASAAQVTAQAASQLNQQSLASVAAVNAPAPVSAPTSTPQEIVQVNITSGGKTVSATINANQKDDLLSMLETLQSRS